MDMVISGITDLTRRFFDEFEHMECKEHKNCKDGCKDGKLPTLSDVKEMFYQSSPAFRNDTIFNNIIEPIYGIEYCERSIKRQQQKTSDH
jgi:hypothetical protein